MAGRRHDRNPDWSRAQTEDRQAYYTNQGVDLEKIEAGWDRVTSAFGRRYHIPDAGGVTPDAPEPAPTPPVPLSAPPEPGLDRARWLGAHITDMTADEDNDRAAHQRRRMAARRALALIAGHEAADPDGDGCVLYGTASLRLTALNEYARRVLDLGEPPIDLDTMGGKSDALL